MYIVSWERISAYTMQELYDQWIIRPFNHVFFLLFFIFLAILIAATIIMRKKKRKQKTVVYSFSLLSHNNCFYTL